MKNAVRWVVLLLVVGLAAIPAWAAELRLTGFLDSAFPHFESNISPPSPDGDSDVTRGTDQHTMGRTRGRMYFNVIASDDLRAVFGFELDAVWGRNPDGAAFSFDRNTDMGGNIETKWLYVDFRIPQLPIGNRWLNQAPGPSRSTARTPRSTTHSIRSARPPDMRFVCEFIAEILGCCP